MLFRSVISTKIHHDGVAGNTRFKVRVKQFLPFGDGAAKFGKIPDGEIVLVADTIGVDMVVDAIPVVFRIHLNPFENGIAENFNAFDDVHSKNLPTYLKLLRFNFKVSIPHRKIKYQHVRKTSHKSHFP